MMPRIDNAAADQEQDEGIYGQKRKAVQVYALRPAYIDDMPGEQGAGDGRHGFGEARETEHKRVFGDGIDLPADDDGLGLKGREGENARK